MAMMRSRTPGWNEKLQPDGGALPGSDRKNVPEPCGFAGGCFLEASGKRWSMLL